MAEPYLRQSPLANLGLAGRAAADAEIDDAGVRLCERPFRGQFALRGDAADPAFRAALSGVTGSEPPAEANTVAGPADLAAGPRLLWLGPDEWLVVTAPEDADRVFDGLRTVLAELPAAVSDVSESRAVIGLAGPAAREVLMKGCGLDLHPRAFGPGRCAQTAFARCHLLIHQTADAPAYELYVHRSFAEYLWAWLEDAAGEYGFKVVAD